MITESTDQTEKVTSPWAGTGRGEGWALAVGDWKRLASRINGCHSVCIDVHWCSDGQAHGLVH